jgi:penicillin-insensitive murein endopeptidase
MNPNARLAYVRIKPTMALVIMAENAASGRQYVHSRVRDTLVAAFSALHAAKPERTFVLGETGLEPGGRFRPHRSHQNGLSVDIFMPVRDDSGHAVLTPTAPWQKFGYALEFDAKGEGSGLSIDFDSLAELVLELNRQAQLHGLALERIIVAPEYIDRVIGASNSGEMAALVGRFTRRPAWVRHDEHLHVDFRVVSGAAPGRVRDRARHLPSG